MKFDQPHLYEIEDMMAFAAKYKKLYIYGCASNQEYLLKFFDTCGVNVDGYITSGKDERELCYRQIPKYTLDAADLTDAGIIIGLSDKYFDKVIPRLRELGFENYFVMSEFNKIKIAHKLTPRLRERMWIEVNLADHCNLNCQCCDHFSQLIDEPQFLDVDVFEKDIARLAELSCGHIDTIKLEGGEPLLNKNVNKFIEITRHYFPNCDISLFTNGLLMLAAEKYEQGNFWQCCVDNRVEVLLTQYPINLNLEKIQRKASEYGMSLEIFGEAADRVFTGNGKERDNLIATKRSTKHPFNLSGNVPCYEFISCYHFNECIALRNGRLHTCSVIPNAHYFNNAFDQHLEISDENSIDIHEAKSYDEIAEFVARRAPFCRYCDIKHRHSLPWARSDKTIDEYI